VTPVELQVEIASPERRAVSLVKLTLNESAELNHGPTKRPKATLRFS
jgi:hypothetical protein